MTTCVGSSPLVAMFNVLGVFNKAFSTLITNYPFSYLTGNVYNPLNIGPSSWAPSLTLNAALWNGHLTLSPTKNPAERGAPTWGHEFETQNIYPSTLHTSTASSFFGPT